MRRFLLFTIALLLLAPLAPAQRSWRIADFSANIDVQQDGSADVTEQITFVFIGSFNGIRRWIPVDYPGPNGTNYSLFLTVKSVTDDQGNKLKYESSTRDAYRILKIYIPGAVDTTRKVYISYHAAHSAKYFDDYDEFYWNVTGNGWSVPIDAASAVVHFPAAGAGKLQARAYVGLRGAKDKAPTRIDASSVTVETANPLSANEGLTVDVKIEKGALKQPGPLDQLVWFVRANGIVLLPLVCFGVMFTLWWYKGRDPDAGISVAPQYEPPAGMTPAEVGTLIDDSTDPRDVSAILVDLAVRGFIKIKEESHSTLGIFKSTDYVFQSQKDSAEWAQLAPFEREMMESIFAFGGNETRLSDLRNRFYTALPGIRSGVMGALKSKGMYYVDPSSAKGYWVLGGILVVAPFLLIHWLTNVDFFAAPLVAVVSIVATLAIFFFFGHYMTAKSLQGVRALVHIKGFQEFMHRVDADRLKRMPPDTFEKFLPYAMALGVEQHWAKAFRGLLQQPPSWYEGYYGPGVFDPFLFTNSLGGMSTAASDTFASAPRAESSSSGFSGGGDSGFSGGGFGGGGGDAF